MRDIFHLLNPFHPFTKVDNIENNPSSQKDKSKGENDAKFQASENLSPMNPTKVDSSSYFDTASLLNPMHPTLWLEHTEPPQRYLGPSTASYNAALGRVGHVYHTLIHRAFASRFRSLHAEEESSSDVKCKGKVVVGGGSGFVGKEVCSLLRRKGYDVIIVSRNKFDSRVVTWDDIKLQGLPEKTLAVVNLAGQNMLDPLKRWNNSFKELVRESRIQTAKSLKDAIVNRHKAGLDVPNVFVQITGVGLYPPGNNDIEYDEYSQIEGDAGGYMSRLVKDWEYAATLPQDVPTRNVFLRSGVVLGRNGGMIQQIFLPFYFGGGGRMGSGMQNMPWIHVKDVSGMILHAIENENVKGPLNASAPQIINNQSFVDAFASALHRPAFIPLPEFVWNIVFGEERAAIITKGVTVIPKRTEEAGYKFKYPDIKTACEEFSFFFYEDSNVE